MPFVSKRQARTCFARRAHGQAKGWDCAEWADKTDQGHLPEKKGMDDLAGRAASVALVGTLARDLAVSPEAVVGLAGVAGLDPMAFVKRAYADPARFTAALPALAKRAALSGVLGGAQRFAQGVAQKGQALTQRANAGLSGGAMDRVLKRLMGEGSPMTSSPVRRLGSAATGVSLGAAGGRSAARAALGGGKSAPSPAASSGPPPMDLKAPDVARSMLAPSKPSRSIPEPPTAAAPKPAGGGGGLMGTVRRHPVATAAAAGAGGLMAGHALGARRDRDKEGMDLAVAVIRRAVTVKLATALCARARADMIGYLDKTAAVLPVPAQAPFRALQGSIAAGCTLGVAVKRAFPMLSAERRGVLADRLARGAKAANANCYSGMPVGKGAGAMPTVSPATFSGKPSPAMFAGM